MIVYVEDDDKTKGKTGMDMKMEKAVDEFAPRISSQNVLLFPVSQPPNTSVAP